MLAKKLTGIALSVRMNTALFVIQELQVLLLQPVRLPTVQQPNEAHQQELSRLVLIDQVRNDFGLVRLIISVGWKPREAETAAPVACVQVE